MSQAGADLQQGGGKSLGYHPFPTAVRRTAARPTSIPKACRSAAASIAGIANISAAKPTPRRARSICILPVLMRGAEIRAAHAGLCKPHRLRQGGEEGARRRLHRPPHRRGAGAAGRDRDAHRLCVQQHTADAATPASASLTIRRPARARSARTTAISTTSSVTDFRRGRGSTRSSAPACRRRRSTISRATISIMRGLGFFGGGYISPAVSGGRPIQVRAVPPGTPRWGSAWKEATAQLVQPHVPDQHARDQLRASQQLSRPRSELQRRDRPAADPHDLQLHRQQLQDVEISHRQGG